MTRSPTAAGTRDRLRSSTPPLDTTVRASSPEPSMPLTVPGRPLLAPMNSATNGGLRLEVDVGLGADLLDAAGVHDHDPVGDRERLRLVMGDVDRRLPGPPLELEDRVLERVAQVPVERGEGLVEEQHAGVGGEHARESHPLLLTAGQLRRHPGAVARQLDERQHLLDARIGVGLFRALDRQPERDVRGDRQVREEGRRLEHEPDVARPRRQPGHVLVVELDPPAARLDEARRSCAASSSCRSPTDRAASPARHRRPRGRARERPRSGRSASRAGSGGRSTSDEVRPLEIARPEDPEEQQDGARTR